MVKMQLHENWQLCNVKEQEWVPAQVPGDIYMALLQAGKMEDPFWEDNEYQAKALMEEDYEYKTVFIYDETEFENCQEVILRFDGIDTIGDIYLNECCLGRVESMHRVWEFPVKEILEKGENCVYEEIAQDIKERDERDMNREIAPLKQAEDAILVDSSEMTIDEVVKTICSYCK